MRKYIAYQTPGGVIWVEIDSSVDDLQNVQVVNDAAFTSFQDVVNAIKANASFLKEELQSINPSGLELSFGINASVNSTKQMFGLSKGVEDANFIIKLKWEAKDED